MAPEMTSDVYAQLVDGVPDAVVVVDERGVVVLVNRQVETLLGYARAELLGQPMERLVPARLRDGHAHHRASYGAHPSVRPMGSALRLTAQHKDGHEIPVEISLGPIVLTTGERLTAAAIRDVTERRRLEAAAIAHAEALRRARDEADRANAAKSEFLASMSHELRTPLNAILGFTQLLQRDRKSPLNERQQERLGHVMRGGEHLLKLVDEVLDLARIEAGRAAIANEAVDVINVLDEARTSLEPLAARSGIRLVLVPPPSDIGAVRADRTRLAQVLMNFGSNAVKYGRPGGHASFSVAVRGDVLRMSVSDDGIGIPEAHRERIFEPFQRAGQETGPIEGTGIGLTITKRLAELMGAQVGFESVDGQGSEFWIDVPRAARATAQGIVRDATRAAREAAARTAHGDARPTRKLIVYVEDNPSNVAFMRAALDDQDHLELAVAPTAEAGLELIRMRRPALVLMDLNLPGMSGIEATRRLAADPDPTIAATPVVALTAAAMPQDQARAASVGFARYLTKPVNVDALLAIIAELVR